MSFSSPISHPSSPLQYLRDISWQEVLDTWQESESKPCNKDQWQEVFTKRGFSDWRQWRQSYYEPLDLPNKQWKLFECTDPEHFVPHCLIGDFEAWKQFYNGPRVSFSELVTNPQIQKYPKIDALVQNFPMETNIIVLFDGQHYTIFEGTHRACAYTICMQNGFIPPTRFLVALSDHQMA